MSSSRNRSSVILAVIIIAIAGWLWFSRQWLVDAAAYYQYTPSAAISQLTKQATFTENAKFTFYATNPQIEAKDAFNRSCPRQDPKSPILGCYANGGIYIYNITDQRLEGIQTVTAAHELLHAQYSRLSSGEKERIDVLLNAAYERLKTEELQRRMKYYDKNEPGQSLNELHSILGSEFDNLGPELEQYYDKFFNNRDKVIALNRKVESVFDGLQKTAEQLVSRINTLSSSINDEVLAYNRDINALNSDIESLNASAGSGLLGQAEFQAKRAQLISRSEQLEQRKLTIKSNVNIFESLKKELDSINAESTDINRSLDSTLSEVPEVK